MNFNLIKQTNKSRKRKTRAVRVLLAAAVITVMIVYSKMRSKVEIDEFVNLKCGLMPEIEVMLTADRSLEEVMLSANCNVSSDDFIEVNSEIVSIQNTKLKDTDDVVVFIVETEEVVEEEILPYDKQIIYDNSLSTGQIVISTPGVNGKHTYTYKYTYINQELIKKELVSTNTTAAVTEVTNVGTKDNYTYTNNPSNISTPTFNNSTTTSGGNTSSENTGSSNSNNTDVDECKITVNGVEYPCE